MAITDQLYSQVLLAHNKRPHNNQKMEKPTHQAECYNALCGDRLQLYFNINDQHIIEELTFDGDCCAVAKASASMMSKKLQQLHLNEAQALSNSFLQLLAGESPSQNSRDYLGELLVFEHLQEYPSRVKCAEMGWLAVKELIQSKFAMGPTSIQCH